MKKIVLMFLFAIGSSLVVFSQALDNHTGTGWRQNYVKNDFRDSTYFGKPTYFYSTVRIAGLWYIGATSVMATAAEMNRLLGITDSVAVRPYVRSQVALRLAKTDTAAMLTPYIARGDTASMLSHFIERTDTANMLSRYARLLNPLFLGTVKIGTDTASTKAYTRQQAYLRVAITDTSAMLSKYPRAVSGVHTGSTTIAGVTMTGATGTGNLVFSANPTFTGVQKLSTTDTLSTKAYARSVGATGLETEDIAGIGFVTADYIIEKISSTYYARPGLGTSYTAYSGAIISTVINSALGELTSGGTVFWKPGLYDASATIVIPYDNIKFVGSGKYLTKLKLKANADAGALNGNLIYLAGKSGFEISNMELDGNKTNQGNLDTRNETPIGESSGISVMDTTWADASDDVLIENCYIHSFTQVGVVVGGSGVTKIADNSIIRNCIFKDNGWAGFMYNSYVHGGLIEGCYFDGNQGGTIIGVNNTLRNCIFNDMYNANSWSASNDALTLESASEGKVEHITVQNCVITGVNTNLAIYSINHSHSVVIDNCIVNVGNYSDCEAIKMKYDTNTIISNVKMYDAPGGGPVGIHLYASVNATVQNCAIYIGEYLIWLSNGAKDCKIMNCYLKSSRYCALVASGTVDNIFMNNVYYSDYSTKINDAGTNTVFSNNYGTYEKLFYTARNASAPTAQTKKLIIAHPGHSGADFTWTSIANHTKQNLDLGAIIPANAKVTEILIKCTEAPTGAMEALVEAGNASGGAQFIASISCNATTEVASIINPDLPAAVVVSTSATNIWISCDPDANFDTMAAGMWTVYVTYMGYN